MSRKATPITEQVTKALFKLAQKDLKQTEEYKGIAARTGIIIQALRSAVARANLYQWSGTPHFYNGKIYVSMTVDEFKGCVYDVLTLAKLNPADFIMIEKIQRITLQAVQSKPLELRRDIIVFENCVLVMPDLTPSDEVEVERDRHPEPTVREHSPELAQTTMCHFNFDPSAKCPKWHTFLDDVLDNAQLRMVLQEFLGCIYIDRKSAKFEMMLILIGNGSNGKGVVSETIRGIVGYDSMTSFGLDSLLVGGESLHNIAKMNGMRVNWCTEIQALQAGRFTDKLKTLISGEPIECRQIYGLPFTATDIPIMIANCNALPPLEDKSYGMQRRFVIIRFDKTIPTEKQDKQLLKRLVPEYAGIFNWLLEGRQRYIDQGMRFTHCRAVDEAVRNYIEASNNVEEWVKAKRYAPLPSSVLEDTPMTAPAENLYEEYRRWCISESIDPFTRVRFGSYLRNLGFKKIRSRDGYTYHIYGEGALKVNSIRKKKELEEQLKQDGVLTNGQRICQGILFDVSDATAAAQWHISRPYLTILRNDGWLFGVWRVVKVKYRTKTYRLIERKVIEYDHYRLGQRLEALGMFDVTDEFAKLSDKRKEQIRQARSFNEEMKKMGQPFRKPVGRTERRKFGKETIIVDLDWEYTADGAAVLKEKKLEEQGKKIKDDATKVSAAAKLEKKGRSRKKPSLTDDLPTIETDEQNAEGLQLDDDDLVVGED